ncbi:protein of unknown function DUF58 [Planctopirus limnophila DSM 3776]|uniref:Uncharacterized protein n=2 Tax=Planctopirus limnophila TaxID=120 RepID=D5SNF1_PLAL2|nr:protein of unknown function DUF58 [Planctopirus limnophila DSM 3776]
MIQPSHRAWSSIEICCSCGAKMLGRLLLKVSSAAHGLLTYDFCPWANRWVYWVKHPLSFLSLTTIAAIACAIWINPYSFIGVAGALLILAVGYVWPYLSMWGVSGEIEFEQTHCSEGESARIQLVVNNRWPWPVWGLKIVCSSSPQAGLATGEGLPVKKEVWASLASIPAGTHSTFTWEWFPSVRGEYPRVIPCLESSFPFGFQVASRKLQVRNRLIVWPKVWTLTSLLDAIEVFPTAEVFSDHRVGDQGDLLGTRAFRQGDSLRRVHWAQTARHGQMIVVERQASIQSRVEIDLPTDRSVHAGSVDDFNASLNWATRLAASLGLAYLAAGSTVTVRVGQQALTVENSTKGKAKLLDALARVQETTDGRHVGHRCDRRGFHLAIVTDKCVQGMHLPHEVSGRMIVIRTCHEGHCEDQHAHDDACLRGLWLDLNPHLGEQFQREWKRVCHAG